MRCIEKKKALKEISLSALEMSPLTGSNRRPTDYKSVALPAELRRLCLTASEKRMQIYELVFIIQTFSKKYLIFFKFLFQTCLQGSLDP